MRLTRWALRGVLLLAALAVLGCASAPTHKPDAVYDDRPPAVEPASEKSREAVGEAFDLLLLLPWEALLF